MNFGTKGCMYNCGDSCTGECMKPIDEVMAKEPPIIGRIIYSEIKEIDHSIITNTDDMSTDEQIEYIKDLFEFEEDKTIMNQMIEELLNQNKDE
jgi:hypothetical protein